MLSCIIFHPPFARAVMTSYNTTTLQFTVLAGYNHFVGNTFRNRFSLCLGVRPSALPLLFDYDLSGLRFRVPMNKIVLSVTLVATLVLNAIVSWRKVSIEARFRKRVGPRCQGWVSREQHPALVDVSTVGDEIMEKLYELSASLSIIYLLESFIL